MDEVTGQDTQQDAGQQVPGQADAGSQGAQQAPPQPPAVTEQQAAMKGPVAQPEQPPAVEQYAQPPTPEPANAAIGSGTNATPLTPEQPEVRPGPEPESPGFLVGSEVARARHIDQPGFEDQLSLLDRDQGLKRKMFIAVSVVLVVFIGGMIAGAIVGIWI
jgi:uncharacterized protein with NAD-binding domain and iron-sulfur cluster